MLQVMLVTIIGIFDTDAKDGCEDSEVTFFNDPVFLKCKVVLV